jgi:hypothetical protein
MKVRDMETDCKVPSYGYEKNEMNSELEHTRSEDGDVNEAEEDDESACESNKNNCDEVEDDR